MPSQPIKTEEEYFKAMARIDEIFFAEVGPEAEELNRLVDAVMAYEDEHWGWDEEE